MNLAGEWAKSLRAEAERYAQLAMASIKREFPADMQHTMTAPGDFPYRPRARNPVFYGSHDWASCVGLHWLLARLLRAAGDRVPAGKIRGFLGAQLNPVALAAEADFLGGPDGVPQRPYNWGWALALAEEIQALGGPDGEKWAAAMAPVTEVAAVRFGDWLAGATHPVRYGMHANSAFGLSLALGHARRQSSAGAGELLDAITARAQQWYAGDTFYPGGWEPSGQDFLSPALTEAVLMAQILPAGEFGGWLSFFLPGIAGGEPAPLFTPAAVPDPADARFAHLHGLNASRAWCWRRIAGALPDSDPRTGPALAAAKAHAEAALPHAAGEEYLAGDWLASFAVLLLSDA